MICNYSSQSSKNLPDTFSSKVNHTTGIEKTKKKIFSTCRLIFSIFQTHILENISILFNPLSKKLEIFSVSSQLGNKRKDLECAALPLQINSERSDIQEKQEKTEKLFNQLERKFSSVVLYGYKKCGYDSFAMNAFLKTDILTLTHINAAPLTPRVPHTEENSKIRGMKDALVRLVFDNIKKQRENTSQPITPCIFCIDTNRSKIEPVDISLKWEHAITVKEMRRAYKLCFDPFIPEEFRQMAQQTFLFVKVNQETTDGCEETNFEIIPPPWSNPVTKTNLENRVRNSSKTMTSLWRGYCLSQLAKLRIDEPLDITPISVFLSILEYNTFEIRNWVRECVNSKKQMNHKMIEEKLATLLSHLYDPTDQLDGMTREVMIMDLYHDANRSDLALKVIENAKNPQFQEYLRSKILLK